MKKGFAYFDKYSILHVTADKKTAHDYGNGNYVEVELNYADGYPKTTEGENIIVYERGQKIRIGGNQKSENGRDVKLENVPFLAPIIEQLNK